MSTNGSYDYRQRRLSTFIARVDNTGGPNACWPWLGNTDRYGYGRFGKNAAGAHRIAYELMVGPIPDGLSIDHLCHNADTTCAGGITCQHRRCVNPMHLQAVTNRENLRRSRHVRPPVNAVKTHCRYGHPFDEANTYRSPRGYRECRVCRRSRDHARWVAKSA